MHTAALSAQASASLTQQELALTKHGYVIGQRDPKVKPVHQGAFMVSDPSDTDEGYAIVGNDRDELVREAYRHLLT